nr:hypothetical protein [Tanacetum cinerariifolium]
MVDESCISRSFIILSLEHAPHVKGLKTEQKRVFSGSFRSRVFNIQDEDEVVKSPQACHWKEHEITVLTVLSSLIGPDQHHLYGSDQPILKGSDYGLIALGSDQNVKELLKYVVINNVIDIYMARNSTSLDTYYNELKDGVLIDDNMPASPSHIEGNLPLLRLGVIYLGNLPLLRPSEITWLEREDCGQDISCGSRKRKETEVEVSGSSKAKETVVEASSNEAEYFDPFKDLDDILDENSMIEDVAVHLQPFKSDMGSNDAFIIIGDLKQSHVDVSEADLDVIGLNSFGSDLEDGINTERRKMLREIKKHSIESRGKLPVTKNDNVRVRVICVGTMPAYNSFDPDVYFSQASIGGPNNKKEKILVRIVIVQQVQSKRNESLTPTMNKLFDVVKKNASQYIATWKGGYGVRGPSLDQCMVVRQGTTVEKNSNNKRKFESQPKDNRVPQQLPFKKADVARTYTIRANERKAYAGILPYCNKCKLHHVRPCTVKLSNCKRVGHMNRDCKKSVVAMNQRAHVVSSKANITCYECGRLGHVRNECQKLRNQNQVNQIWKKKLAGTLVSTKTRLMLKKRYSRLT